MYNVGVQMADFRIEFKSKMMNFRNEHWENQQQVLRGDPVKKIPDILRTGRSDGADNFPTLKEECREKIGRSIFFVFIGRCEILLVTAMVRSKNIASVFQACKLR